MILPAPKFFQRRSNIDNVFSKVFTEGVQLLQRFIFQTGTAKKYC